MFCCLCHAVPQNTAVPGMRRAQGGSSLQGVELCPTLSVQGSQPSTASPFKQDVFIYSASPGSDSPSVGAAATPVIMSRSPTGGFWGSLGWGQLWERQWGGCRRHSPSCEQLAQLTHSAAWSS